jgi:hypothetical protein
MTLLEENTNRIDVVANGFSFPTGVTFAEDEIAYVAETGLLFGDAPPGGRIGFDGRQFVILDFGELEMREQGNVIAEPGSGKLWRLRLTGNSR